MNEYSDTDKLFSLTVEDVQYLAEARFGRPLTDDELDGFESAFSELLHETDTLEFAMDAVAHK